MVVGAAATKDFTKLPAPLLQDTGHFTQVVWRGTREVGCGYNRCGGKLAYALIMCFYDPPGNNRGAMAANVPEKPIC